MNSKPCDLANSNIGVSFNGLLGEVKFLYGLQEWIYCVYVCVYTL